METCSYLIELVLDGESEGKIPFDSKSTTACDVIEEFLSNEEIASDFGVDLQSVTVKRMEKFSAKFEDWIRVRTNAIVCDGDSLRVVAESNSGEILYMYLLKLCGATAHSTVL